MGYDPTPEEKKAIKLVQNLFERAKTHRKKFDEKWLDYYKMFRGKQWKEARPSYRHSEVVNFVFQAIQSSVPVLTDSRPRFDFLPQEPQDMEIAQILSEVSQSDWERGNWSYTLTEMVYDAHFMGTGIPEVGFDPDAEYGKGRITFDSKDPFYVFPDPEAQSFKKKCRYVVIAEPVDVDVVKREYPDKRDFIKADVIDLMGGDKTDLDQVRFKSPTDNKVAVEGTSAFEAGHKNQVVKFTCYLLSDEFLEEKKETPSPDGEITISYEQKLKYPNGRKICVANGVLLSDGEIPFDVADQSQLFPFARITNYIDPRSFWGIGDVEQLESPQKIFNKLVSFALDVLTLMGNPIWIVDNNSDVDTDNLFNKPGLIVEKSPNSEVRREEGVQLQPYVLQLIDRMANWFQEISGRTDVTNGASPGGVTAASAINQLQEAAQTRLRLKSRNIDAGLQDCGQHYKNRVFQFYTAPQVFRLTNNENAQKYFKFYVENEELPDGTVQRKAVVRNYTPRPDGTLAEDLVAREFIIRSDFDVRVSSGSTLPYAKEQKANLGFKLFEAGAIDEPELLEATDYPNKEAVWARVQERQMQKAQAEMEAQAAAQGAPPPPAAPPAA
jgi:hypothetical protein